MIKLIVDNNIKETRQVEYNVWCWLVIVLKLFVHNIRSKASKYINIVLNYRVYMA